MVFPIATAPLEPTATIEPANPTKVPCGTVSKLDGEGVLVFAWNTVLPILSASRDDPPSLGKVPD